MKGAGCAGCGRGIGGCTLRPGPKNSAGSKLEDRLDLDRLTGRVISDYQALLRY